MRALETYLSELSGKNMEPRRTRLGQHGHRLGRRKLSNFGVQRREKQKLQCNHGLREKQLSRLVKEAHKSNMTGGDRLAELLGRRRDNNIVLSADFARTSSIAIQLVAHGYI